MQETGSPVQKRKEGSSLEDGEGRFQEESNVASLESTQSRWKPGREFGKMVWDDELDRIFDMFGLTEWFRRVKDSVGWFMNLYLYLYAYI